MNDADAVALGELERAIAEIDREVSLQMARVATLDAHNTLFRAVGMILTTLEGVLADLYSERETLLARMFR